MAGRVELKPQTDEEAVRYLTSKQVGARLSFDWRDVREEEHVTSFVVAKAMNSSILSDIYGELTKAIEEGRTLESFKRDLRPLLEAKGWWGRDFVRDPKTGALVEAQLGSARRLETIFNTNMMMAHSAGRWERMTRSARPGDLLRYMHTPQAHPRLDHQAWHGITLPIDHPFWKTHYTPNGWGCKCFTVLIPASRVRREGIVATSEADLTARGYGKTVAWRNRRTGQVEQIPAGIDPGFAYNVGEARLRAFTPAPEPGGLARTPARPSQSSRPPLPPARPFTGRQLAEDASDEAALNAFLDVFEGRAREVAPGQLVFDDAAQVPLAISDRLFAPIAGGARVVLGDRKADLPMLAATIADPDEIWASFEELRDATGRVTGRAWRRRYVARWSMPGSIEARQVVFEEDGSTWSDALSDANLNEAREGVLIYRRAEP